MWDKVFVPFIRRNLSQSCDERDTPFEHDSENEKNNEPKVQSIVEMMVMNGNNRVMRDPLDECMKDYFGRLKWVSKALSLLRKTKRKERIRDLNVLNCLRRVGEWANDDV